MIAYRRDELVSTTDFIRQFGQITKSLVAGLTDKIAIMKNNKPELVVLPVEEYEKLAEAYEMMEYAEMHEKLKQRENDKNISLDEMINRLGIDEQALQD